MKTILRKIAEQAAERLFANGSGQTAHRLVLESKGGADLGGWCKGPVADQIEDTLMEALTGKAGR